MSDIFLSYATADRVRAQRLAEALESLGFSVWWDRDVPIGEPFDTVIQRELEAARAVVVVWTKHALKSRWVRSEAELAVSQGKALPVRMDAVELPLGLRLVQTADLTDWRGETEHAGFQRLLEQLTSRLQRVPKLPYKHRLGKGWRNGVGLLTLILLGLTALLRVPETSVELDVETSDMRFVSLAHQDLTGLITTPILKMAGVRKLRIPRSATGPTQHIASDTADGTHLILQDRAHTPDIAAITLEALPLKPGVGVRIFVAANEAGLSIALDGGPFDFQVNLQDRLEFSLPQHTLDTLEFAAPRPMKIMTVQHGVTLSLTSGAESLPLNPEPLVIGELGFFRYEERAAGTDSRGRRIPTIIDGGLRVTGSFNAARQLGDHSDIRIHIARGEIVSIHYHDSRIRLLFRGSVTQLELCQPGCENLMPSYLERTIRHFFGRAATGG